MRPIPGSPPADADTVLSLASQLRWSLPQDIHDRLTASLYRKAEEIAAAIDAFRELVFYGAGLADIATQLAGLDVIPAVVRDVSDEAAIAMALIENIQREDLNPLEEARALDRLIREFDLEALFGFRPGTEFRAPG